MANIESMEKLANSFSKLPTVGSKTALRYAYSIINMNEQDVQDFAENLLNVKRNIHYCTRCGNWCEKELCPICEERQSSMVIVVKEPKDILALEKVKNYEGTYHVLHGTLNPLEGKGPNDIRIKELLARISVEGIQEVVMALNSDVEGEATSLYLANLLKPLGVKVSRLAQGISMGSDIEYQDEVTLSKALEDRKTL